MWSPGGGGVRYLNQLVTVLIATDKPTEMGGVWQEWRDESKPKPNPNVTAIQRLVGGLL